MSDEDYSWRSVDKFVLPRVKYKYSVSVRDYVMDMVIQYFIENRDKECFSYADFRHYLYNVKKKRIEWHTVERVLRYLAQVKYLKRVFLSKNKVVFCRE